MKRYDIIRLVRSEELGCETESSELVTPQHIEPELVLEARRQAQEIMVSDLVENYIVALVMMATRKQNVTQESNLAKWIEIGSKSSTLISLDKCARCLCVAPRA